MIRRASSHFAFPVVPLLGLSWMLCAATASAQEAAPAATPAAEDAELPPAPPPAPGADEAPPPPPATEPTPAPTAPAAAPPPAQPGPAVEPDCPLGQRRDGQGHCVDSDPDQWTEGNAPIPPSLTGHHTHDGFMLRLGIGLGAAVASADIDTPLVNETAEVDVGGLGLLSSLDIGGTIAQTLVLHGRLAFATVFEPTVEVNGDEIGEANDARLRIVHLAPALTYYIMPYNIYFTGSVGLAFATLEGDDGSIDTDPGFGMSLDFGKEWWVASDWGLGVGLRLMMGSVKLEDRDDRAGVGALGVIFTATYQ